MHQTALNHGKAFRDRYATNDALFSVLDVGSMDVNGSLRQFYDQVESYTGLDFSPGPGVDLILSDPYTFPIPDNFVDVALSSSCFEHSEFFWLTFLEILRTLKPNGLFYLNAPSNGSFHQYPVDCYRFYPDAGIALQNWGRRNGFSITLLESFIGPLDQDGFNDFVAVFRKTDPDQIAAESLMCDVLEGISNSYVFKQ